MKDRVLGIVTHVMVMAIVIAVILLFMGIIILILFHLCITGGVFRRGLGNDGTVDRGSLGSSSMSRDDVEKLPCFDYKDKEKGEESPADCAVCLEDFKAGEKCRLLPLCKHSFHARCVDSWLLITPICPICRTCADSWSWRGEEEGRSRLDGIVIELRESQTVESGELNDAGNGLSGLSERVGSSHLDGFVIELGDNQTENTVELGESQTIKSGDLNDIGGELRDNQTVERCAQSV